MNGWGVTTHQRSMHRSVIEAIQFSTLSGGVDFSGGSLGETDPREGERSVYKCRNPPRHGQEEIREESSRRVEKGHKVAWHRLVVFADASSALFVLLYVLN
jgi:hypothetical protein